MYNTSLFTKGFGASIGVLLLILAIGVYTGVAYAVPIAGVGGYTVTADSIEGEDATIYPTMGDTSGAGERPVNVVELQSTTIEGLKIVKPVDLPGTNNDVNVVIESSGTVESDEILLKASSVAAGDATLTGLEIDETGPNGQLQLRAAAEDHQQGRHVTIEGSEPGVQLENPELQTHYLVTNRIGIPGLDVHIETEG